MAQKLLSLGTPITCMAFNADCSQLAVGLINNQVQVFQFQSPNKWNKIHTLDKHISRITGIDWCSNTGKIVTVSADRNAYVWQLTGNEWKPQLVLLRISKAATCVKWSPNGDKFAVGTAARLVTVCYFESSQNAWVSKHIKKDIRSTVLCIDWHPGNIFLAVGSSDYTCKIFSAYVKEIESKPTDLSWSSKPSFGVKAHDVKLSCWVNSVSFSPDGSIVAIAGHDSTMRVLFTNGVVGEVFYGKNLPFCDLLWTNSNQIVGVGHNNCAYLMEVSGQGVVTCKGRHLGANAVRRGNIGAMWQQRDKAGQEKASTVNTAHRGVINQIRVTNGGPGRVASFATSAGDGKVCMWNWTQLVGQLEQI